MVDNRTRDFFARLLYIFFFSFCMEVLFFKGYMYIHMIYPIVLYE
jgi:hypothetical protein